MKSDLDVRCGVCGHVFPVISPAHILNGKPEVEDLPDVVPFERVYICPKCKAWNRVKENLYKEEVPNGG